MTTELCLADLQQLALKIGDRLPYLKFLVLFGSRARGDAYERSDWDFAIFCDEEERKKVIADQEYGFLEVHNAIEDCFAINGEYMDVVDVMRCSTLIAHYVARDGRLLYERDIGTFEQFCKQSLMSELELKILQRGLREKVEISLKRRGYA
jgi:uncharacterized protein